MSRRLLLPLAVVFAASCADDIGIGRVSADLVVDAEVDFGDVPVGLVKKRILVLKNDGTGSLSITEIVRGEGFTGDRYLFGAPTAGVSISAQGEQRVELSFQPLAAEEAPYTSDLTFVTNAADSSGNIVRRTVTLKGRGVRAAVEVVPNPLDFGRVLAGSTRTLSVRVTNLLADPIPLTTEVDGSGTALARVVSGGGRFVITAPVSSGGSLLPEGQMLEAGASIELPVRYEPEAVATGRSDTAKWNISTCADPLCELTINLIGQATDSAVVCEPAALDFGAVNPGRTLSRVITCTNVASDTITLAPWSLDASSDQAFGIAPFPGTSTVSPGSRFEVPVDFTPTQAMLASGAQAMGIAVVRGTGPGGGALTPIQIALTGRAGGPTIEVTPGELHFGPLAIGTRRTRSLVVTNSGYEDLVISRVEGDRAMTGAFRATPPSIVLPVGTTTVVRVTFEPVNEGPVASTVIIESNDAISPSYPVPVDGAGLRLPPCEYTVSPPNVSYGVIIAGETATTAVTITNTGDDACLINDIEISSAFPMSSHQLVAGTETGVMLAPGASKSIALRYTPVRTGPEAAELTFFISDPAAPDVRVPLFGTGQATTEIVCPPNQTVPAGAPVLLTAMGMTLGRTVTGYQWNIVSAPMGGIGTPDQWDPDPPTSASELFLPFIVGRYVVEATVFDSDGGSASCQTTIDAEGSGLRVTLTWDGPGDVDLHLHRPGSNQPWFGGFAGTDDDCYYANTTPQWDPMSAPAVGPNPSLDFDNTSQDGPENTTVLVPQQGVDYTIGVHNFSRSAGRIATVQIFCGGGIVPVATYTSRPLAGNDAGDCTQNDFWKVAAIRFLGPGTCVDTPINTYVTSNDACTTF